MPQAGADYVDQFTPLPGKGRLRSQLVEIGGRRQDQQHEFPRLCVSFHLPQAENSSRDLERLRVGLELGPSDAASCVAAIRRCANLDAQQVTDHRDRFVFDPKIEAIVATQMIAKRGAQTGTIVRVEFLRTGIGALDEPDPGTVEDESRHDGPDFPRLPQFPYDIDVSP